MSKVRLAVGAAAVVLRRVCWMAVGVGLGCR